MKNDDKVFAESIREIENEGKPAKGHPNYGVISVGIMAIAICSFLYGFQLISKGVSCIFAGAFGAAGANSGELDAKTGVLVVIGSFVLLILSWAMAGAGIATERGGFLSLFVIVGSIAPFGYAMYVILFGVPADLMGAVSPPASSTVTTLPSGSSMGMNPTSKC